MPAIVKLVHIHSDNPASLFKNKDTMASIIRLEKKHDIKIFWHYFATMHGKGVVDGVDAVVKRMESNKVRAEDAEITNAETFEKCFYFCIKWLGS